MDKKDKLIEKLRSNPKSFTYAEAVSLLDYFDYQEDNKGKTSGSRVVFRKDATSAKFALCRKAWAPILRSKKKESIIRYVISRMPGKKK